VKQHPTSSEPGQCLNRHCRRSGNGILTVTCSVTLVGYSPKAQRNSVLCKARRLVAVKATVERCLGKIWLCESRTLRLTLDHHCGDHARAGIPVAITTSSINSNTSCFIASADCERGEAFIGHRANSPNKHEQIVATLKFDKLTINRPQVVHSFLCLSITSYIRCHCNVTCICP
jgi:hypothetical protein